MPANYNLDIDLRSLDLDESPLHLTCKNNDLSLAKILLEHGARVNESTRTNCATPCMLAASAKDNVVPLLKLSIEEFKANFNLIDNSGSSVL